MATLAKQIITLAGVAPTYGAAAAGDKVVPGATTFLHVKNTSGAPITVTLDDPTSPSPAAAVAFNPDVTVSVPATTGDRMIGPLTERFANPADGLVAITYSATAGVTVAALVI